LPSHSKITLMLTAGILLSLLAFLPGVAYASNGWAKYSSNPVLTPTAGSWDSAYTVSPRVLYDGKIYRMWYDGGSSSGFAGIGLATSRDGLTWTKRPDPVFAPSAQGAWDSASVSLGSVLWNGTMFLMWYRGTNTTTLDTGAIGLAWSKDGISWTKYVGNPVLVPSAVDQGYIASPYVLKTTLTYNMWYTAKNATAKSDPSAVILYATSLNGINWVKWPSTVFSPSKDPSAWDSGTVYSPSIYYNGTTFGMWYSGLDRSLSTPQIGLATSPDGSTWVRSSLNPVLSPGSFGAWDSAGVEHPNVVLGGMGYMLYYDGLGDNAGGRIGLAQTPGNPQVVPVPEFPYVSLLLGVTVCVEFSLLRLRKKSEN
jgi:predicted GH43/DUF377 family glycosyl hydrolase